MRSQFATATKKFSIKIPYLRDPIMKIPPIRCFEGAIGKFPSIGTGASVLLFPLFSTPHTLIPSEFLGSHNEVA